MKKIISILSIATASALMAGNVELYGVAHVSGDSVNNGKNSTVVFASNSSRLGIKGSHAINNDLTILGQFEVGVDVTGTGTDDGNGGDYKNAAGMFTSARDSYVGIKSNKGGMLLAGNLPAMNQYMYDYNLFADQAGDLGNIWGGASAIGVDRASSTVAYFIPSVVKGLSGDVAYVSDVSGSNDGKKLTAVLLKANYAISGLKVGVTYIALTNDTVTPGRKPTDLAFTTSYTRDNFSIGGGYLHANADTGTNATRNAYTAGASFTMNATTLKAQWAGVSDDVTNKNANMIAVGADYALSKDATVYVAYAGTSNDTAASYGANGWGHGKSAYGSPVAGNDPKTFSLGLIYKFGGTIYKN